jgi:phospholipid/cholesterol/gamma-HCH transport system substrate-binding protein
MEDRRLLVGVGLLVLAATCLGVMLMLYFGSFRSLVQRSYGVTINFPQAPGISVGSAVYKNGVKIGRVRELRLHPEQGVDVAMEIESRFPLRQSEVPRIRTGSLITGDAVVEFISASDDQLVAAFDGQAGTPADGRIEPEERALAQRPLTDGAYMNTGVVAGDPLEVLVNLEDEVRSALNSVGRAGDAVTQLAADVRTVFGGEKEGFRMLAEQTRGAIDDFRGVMRDLDDIVGDEQSRQNIKQSIESLPQVLTQTQDTLLATRRALESFERVGVEAEQTVKNLSEFTAPLGARGEELLDLALRNLTSLDAALSEISTFGRQLNRGEGTVGRLMGDDQLYWDLKRLIGNVEGITEQIRPILDDARTFSDKIARDPRQLGVKGALDRRPSGLGLK